MADDAFNMQRGPGIADLVAALKATPDRLDKEMRKEFRRASVPIKDEGRAKARRMHPVPKTPKHKGSYRWSQLVNSITAGSDSDTPTVRFGNASVPGFFGWEGGSDRFPQFPAKVGRIGSGTAGRFLFPAIREGIADLQVSVATIVENYAAQALGEV